MAETVYILSALASALASVLLARGYVHSRSRLLLWSAVCFGWLAVNNIVLFFDKIVVTSVDLSLVRSLTAFVGIACLLYGLIWESR